MKFLIDRCAGRRVARWLREQGHDVAELRGDAVDPGDAVILERAVAEDRVRVTIDTDFGELVFREGKRHRGLLRLPDVPAPRRIELLGLVLSTHAADLEAGTIVTVRGTRIRVTRSGGTAPPKAPPGEAVGPGEGSS